MGNNYCGIAVFDVFMLSQLFAQAFCQAGEADMQEYAPAQMTSSLGFFCTLLIIAMPKMSMFCFAELLIIQNILHI